MDEYWKSIPIKIQNSAALLKTGLFFGLEVNPLEPCAQTESESLFFGLNTTLDNSCPRGYSSSPTKKCYKFFKEALTWQGASYSCQADRGWLATIISYEDNSFVLNTMAGQSAYWIGFSDIEKEGDWVWVKYTGEQYVYWASGEPNGETGENCAVTNAGSGTWNDAPCGNPHWFVCQKNPVSTKSQIPGSHSGRSWKNVAAAKTRNLDIATPDAVCRLGYLKSPDGSWCYRFFSAPATWYDASKICQADNAWLATIHDLEENKFATDWAAPKSVWIGLNDINEEGTWVWTHPDGGDFVGVRPWAPYEPNDSGGQDCAQIYGAEAWWGAPGKWDDAGCDSKLAFFCQTAMQQSDISSTELSSASQNWYPGFSLVCNKNSWSDADQFDHTIRVQFGSTKIWPRTAVVPVGEYSQVRLELRDMQEQNDGNGEISYSVGLNLIVAGGTSLLRHKLNMQESREFFLTLQSVAFPNNNLAARNLLIAPIDIPRTFALTNKYSEFTLTQGNLVGVVSLPSVYTVTFDLFPTADGTTFRNIIHLSANGRDDGAAGSNAPAVWFCASDVCPSMGIRVGYLPGQGYHVINTALSLALNTWSTVIVTIDTIAKIMTLTVTGGVTIPTMSVAFPTPSQLTWPSVQVYASDPWYDAAATKIRNLAIAPPAALPASYYPASSYASGFTLYQGNLVGVVSLPAAYTVSFDLFLSTAPTASSCVNIIHLTATGTNGGAAGSRIPGVWFCPNFGFGAWFQFSSGDGFVVAGPASQAPLFSWFTVTLAVDLTQRILTIGASPHYPAVMTNMDVSQTSWPSVQVYASDPWHEAADGKIRNLVIAPPAALPASYYPASSYASGFALSKGNLVGVVSLPAAYTLSFDLFPAADGTTWRSIVLLTATGSDEGVGGRIPWVLFTHSALGPTLGLNVFNYGSQAEASSSGGQTRFSTSQSLPLNTWSAVTITMDFISKVMTMTVSGGVTIPTMSTSILTPAQTSWPSVQVYASDPGYPAASAKIRNLAIAPPAALPASYYPTSSYPSGFTLSKGNLVGVVSLPVAYTVSFDLFPTADGTTWRSILLLSTTVLDDYKAGSRLPYVCFPRTGAGAGLTLGLHVDIISSASGTYQDLNPAVALPLNIWSTVLINIDATALFMTLGVTGGVVIPTMSVALPTPAQETWPSVQVYAGAGFANEVAAAAKIRNLAIRLSSDANFVGGNSIVAPLKRERNSICCKASEGQDCTLACPPGSSVTRIDFASYGTPTGACSDQTSFSLGGCSSAMSSDVVSAACLGRQGCGVSATNQLFGDPCAQVPKVLAIRATCDGGIVPSQFYHSTESRCRLQDQDIFSSFIPLDCLPQVQPFPSNKVGTVALDQSFKIQFKLKILGRFYNQAGGSEHKANVFALCSITSPSGASESRAQLPRINIVQDGPSNALEVEYGLCPSAAIEMDGGSEVFSPDPETDDQTYYPTCIDKISSKEWAANPGKGRYFADNACTEDKVKPCEIGTYYDGKTKPRLNTCAICPVNTYQDEEKQSECKECPTNQLDESSGYRVSTVSNAGSTTDDDCQQSTWIKEQGEGGCCYATADGHPKSEVNTCKMSCPEKLIIIPVKAFWGTPSIGEGCGKFQAAEDQACNEPESLKIVKQMMSSSQTSGTALSFPDLPAVGEYDDDTSGNIATSYLNQFALLASKESAFGSLSECKADLRSLAIEYQCGCPENYYERPTIICSPKKLCVGMRNNLPYCYGRDSGCKWHENDCNKDVDCSKYTEASPAYTDGKTCDQIKVGDWAYDACTHLERCLPCPKEQISKPGSTECIVRASIPISSEESGCCVMALDAIDGCVMECPSGSAVTPFWASFGNPDVFDKTTPIDLHTSQLLTCDSYGYGDCNLDGSLELVKDLCQNSQSKCTIFPKTFQAKISKDAAGALSRMCANGTSLSSSKSSYLAVQYSCQGNSRKLAQGPLSPPPSKSYVNPPSLATKSTWVADQEIDVALFLDYDLGVIDFTVDGSRPPMSSFQPIKTKLGINTMADFFLSAKFMPAANALVNGISMTPLTGADRGRLALQPPYQYKPPEPVPLSRQSFLGTVGFSSEMDTFISVNFSLKADTKDGSNILILSAAGNGARNILDLSIKEKKLEVNNKQTTCAAQGPYIAVFRFEMTGKLSYEINSLSDKEKEKKIGCSDSIDVQSFDDGPTVFSAVFASSPFPGVEPASGTLHSLQYYLETQSPTVTPSSKPSVTPTPRPSSQPTCLPTNIPVNPPTANPTCLPTALPTKKPIPQPTKSPTPDPSALPTLSPTQYPSAIPTPAPTCHPTRTAYGNQTAQGKLLGKAAPWEDATPYKESKKSRHLVRGSGFFNMSLGTSYFTNGQFQIPGPDDAAFAKGLLVTGLNHKVTWYMSVYIYGTGWGNGVASLEIFDALNEWRPVRYDTMIEETGELDSVAFQCQPGNSCQAKGTKGSGSLMPGAKPYECMANYPIKPTSLLPADGGSVRLRLSANGFRTSQCNFESEGVGKVPVYATFVFRANHTIATYLPTASPTPVPTRGLPNGKALAAAAPLPVTFLFTVIYGAVGFFLAQLYAKTQNVQKPPLANAIIAFALLGSSFCSEIYTLTFMVTFPQYQYLALGVVVFRSTHLICFFVNVHTMFFKKVDQYKLLLDLGLIFDNSKIFGVLAIICMTDATAFSMLPWLDSEITQKAGYPNFFFFVACLGTKTLQGVVATSALLFFNVGINSGETLQNMSLTNKVFLGLNVLTTATMVVLNIIDLLVKTAVLYGGTLKTAPEMPPRTDELEMVSLNGALLSTKDISSFRRALRTSLNPDAVAEMGISAVDFVKMQARLDRLEDEIPEEINQFGRAMSLHLNPEAAGMGITAADFIQMKTRLERLEDDIPARMSVSSLSVSGLGLQGLYGEDEKKDLEALDQHDRFSLSASNPMHSNLPSPLGDAPKRLSTMTHAVGSAQVSSALLQRRGTSNRLQLAGAVEPTLAPPTPPSHLSQKRSSAE